VKQVSEHIWLVIFMDYDLGYLDENDGALDQLLLPNVRRTAGRP
jgi:hypothetical protein